MKFEKTFWKNLRRNHKNLKQKGKLYIQKCIIIVDLKKSSLTGFIFNKNNKIFDKNIYYFNTFY